MPERAVSFWIGIAELEPIIERLRDFTYVILDRRLVRDPVQDLHIGRFTPGADFSAWDEGRVFGKSAEIHWVRSGSQIHVVVAGELPDFPGLASEEMSLEAYQPEEKKYLLWGIRDARDTGLWWESRIPRDFSYPITNAPEQARPQLIVREYCDRETGECCFWRCLGFAFERPHRGGT